LPAGGQEKRLGKRLGKGWEKKNAEYPRISALDLAERIGGRLQ